MDSATFVSGKAPLTSQKNQLFPVFPCQSGAVQLGVLFLLLTVSLGLQGAAAELADDKPQTVYVSVESARIYSGPSIDFYPTNSLKRGEVLEVYQRTKNGWLGVRPPEGSFSWVPAAQAYLLPGGRVIEITDAEAVSWIGTDLGSAKQYRWQIQLKVGEQLTVLGESSIKSGSDEEQESLWYRVAPPAGEFRWIEHSAVSEHPPEASALQADQEKTQQAVAAKPTSGAEVQSASYIEPIAQVTEGTEAPANKVVSASAESASKPTTAAPTKATQSNNRPSQRNANNWDGWHALEMGAHGMRSPLLDKLSGRDQGSATTTPANAKPGAHDPLIHDPFSLAMVGEPAKVIPEDVATKIAAKSKRVWRDPRSLRDSPMSEYSRSNREFARSDTLNPASDASYVSSASNESASGMSTVSSAGFQSATHEQNGASPTVNWFGVAPSNPAAQSPAQNASTSTENLATSSIAELQVALNEMVSAQPTSWNLSPLAERARYLIEHGPTAIDRGHARLLLERIDAFQNVAQRSGSLPGNLPVQFAGFSSPATATATQNTSQSIPVRTSVDARGAGAGSYDATGWLVPVHSTTPDQPTHAITNDAGDIIAYVSGIPGLNLDRYKNQAVGITGLRGYLTQLRAPHIQAQRISALR